MFPGPDLFTTYDGYHPGVDAVEREIRSLRIKIGKLKAKTGKTHAEIVRLDQLRLDLDNFEYQLDCAYANLKSLRDYEPYGGPQ